MNSKSVDSKIAESASLKLSDKDTGSSSNQYQYGLTSAIFIIVNSIIGSGIFSTPASVYKHAGSVGLSLMLWLVGGFVSLCGSLMALEFGTGIPVSGGLKNYLERSIPNRRLLGTCFYIFYCTFLQVSTSSAISFANYILLAAGQEVTTWKIRGIAIASVSFAVLIFAFFPRAAMYTNNVFGAIKIIMLLFVIFTGKATLLSSPKLGFAALGGHIKLEEKPDNFDPKTLFHGTKTNAYDISTALLNCIFSYQGYDQVNAILSEVRNPARTLKIAMPVAMAIVTTLNILANVAYFAGVSIAQFRDNGVTVAGSLFLNVFGDKAGNQVLPVLVALSALGHLISMSKSISVVLQVLAKEDVLIFNDIFTTSKPFGSPLAGLCVVWAVTVIFVCAPPPGDAYDFVVSLTSYPYTLMLFFCAVGAFKLRYFDKDWDPPYRAPIVGLILFILACLFLLIAPFIPPEENNSSLPYYLSSVVSLSITMLGVVWYSLKFVLVPFLFRYKLVPIYKDLTDGSRMTRYKRISKE
ncbi:putative methionine permease [Wallemia mellicola]|nr:putative methionine permease [Wallemia mellicola]